MQPADLPSWDVAGLDYFTRNRQPLPPDPPFPVDQDINAKIAFWMGGDLERLSSDAVVIGCDDRLRPSGSISRDIHGAAGDRLSAACSRAGSSDVGLAVRTPGFNLPAKFVLHTPGLVGQPPLIIETALRAALDSIDGGAVRTLGIAPDASGNRPMAVLNAYLGGVRHFLSEPANLAKTGRIVIVIGNRRDQLTYYGEIPRFFPVPAPKWEVTLDEIETWAVGGSELPPDPAPLFPANPEINGKLSFWKRGNSARLAADAVVNAANEELSAGGGICGAIHSAAGPMLAEECHQIGFTATGRAAKTSGYDLPAKYVIHAVGPTKQDPIALKGAYVETLRFIDGAEIRSIGLCCISTGVFGYPIVPATELALATVREFLENPENRAKTDRIVFVVYEPRDVAVYTDLLPKYFPLG